MRLEMIDDNDETYVNGIEVGATNGCCCNVLLAGGVLEEKRYRGKVKIPGGGGVW